MSTPSPSSVQALIKELQADLERTGSYTALAPMIVQWILERFVRREEYERAVADHERIEAEQFEMWTTKVDALRAALMKQRCDSSGFLKFHNAEFVCPGCPSCGHPDEGPCDPCGLTSEECLERADKWCCSDCNHPIATLKEKT